MAIHPITADLKKIVTKVANKAPRTIFNDKRVTFERRYKFAGIRDLTKKQVAQIHRKISEKHPGAKFEVINVKTSGAKWSNHNAYNGLIVKVM